MGIDQFFLFIFLSIVKSQNWLAKCLETTAQFIVLVPMVNIQIDLALTNELIQHCMDNLWIEMDIFIAIQRTQIISHICVTGYIKMNARQGLG